MIASQDDQVLKSVSSLTMSSAVPIKESKNEKREVGPKPKILSVEEKARRALFSQELATVSEEIKAEIILTGVVKLPEGHVLLKRRLSLFRQKKDKNCKIPNKEI